MGETNGDLFFDVGVMVLTCMAEGLSDLVLQPLNSSGIRCRRNNLKKTERRTPVKDR